jgi:hypothetical protein
LPLHGRARQAVLVQRDRHRGAAGPLRRLARVHRSRRHLLHKVPTTLDENLNFAGFVLVSHVVHASWLYVLKQRVL